MRVFFKYIFALHVSLAYLGMLTGFGMVFFTVGFVTLLTNSFGLPVVLHALLTYLLLVIGPGAMLLAIGFYHKMHRRT